jgi:hypothetical protein
MSQLFKFPILPSVVLATLLLPLPAGAQDSNDSFGESIDVRVVNVEAVVTDRAGTRVFGLTPDDFQVLVDGEEVPIDFFTEFRGGRALRDVGASPWGVAPISDVQAEGTSYLVFIDDFFSLRVDRNRVLRALEDELAFLGPEDRMAIVAWDGVRAEMLSTWTSSGRDLRRALQSAADRPARGLERLAERRAILSGTILPISARVLGRRGLRRDPRRPGRGRRRRRSRDPAWLRRASGAQGDDPGERRLAVPAGRVHHRRAVRLDAGRTVRAG